jgi:outer membrane protein assembly factor BamB
MNFYCVVLVLFFSPLLVQLQSVELVWEFPFAADDMVQFFPVDDYFWNHDVFVMPDGTAYFNFFQNVTGAFEGPIIYSFDAEGIIQPPIVLLNSTEGVMLTYDPVNSIFIGLEGGLNIQNSTDVLLFGINTTGGLQFVTELAITERLTQALPFLLILDPTDDMTYLYAIDSADGTTVIWKNSIDIGLNNMAFANSFPSSTTNGDNTYLLVQNDTMNAMLYILDADDGTFVDQMNIQVRNNMTRLHIDSIGEYFYVLEFVQMGPTRMILFNADGTVNWMVYGCDMPVFSNTTIVFCINGTGQFPNITFQTDAYELSTGMNLWSTQVFSPNHFLNNNQDILYVVDHKRHDPSAPLNLIALDIATGGEIQEYEIDGLSRDTRFFTTPIDNSNFIVVNMTMTPFMHHHHHRPLFNVAGVLTIRLVD